MAETVLVNRELESGGKIIDALDQSGLKISVGLWATLSEFGDSRLILASPELNDENPQKNYGKVFAALKKKNVVTHQAPPLLVLRMKDPFIRDLRHIFGKTASVDGMRLGGQYFGDRFIEEGYVYRIS
jgi:hypothetical protein